MQAVQVDELTDITAHHEVAALFERIWHSPVLDPSTLHALSHVGNYVAGAFDGGLVGAAVGFFAADGHLHSHVTGVAPEYQGRGLGAALKWHQREWTLARHLRAISWTFDPLIARNAYFNLHKLGAGVTAYLPDFYGPIDDAMNAGGASDRLFVEWRLDSSAPIAPSAPDADDAAVLLGRDGDEPVAGSRRAARLSVATPDDLEGMLGADRELAVRWRMEVRDALVGAMDAGYRITGISREGRYVLEAE